MTNEDLMQAVKEALVNRVKPTPEKPDYAFFGQYLLKDDGEHKYVKTDKTEWRLLSKEEFTELIDTII